MNKKAFLAGDTIVSSQSFITLVIIALLFSLLFYFNSASDLFKEKKYSLTIENPFFKSYETTNYYLYTRFKTSEKITNLAELIPIYCYAKDPKILVTIQRASLVLLPKPAYLNIYCIYGSDCSLKKENYKTIPVIRMFDLGKVELDPAYLQKITLPSYKNEDSVCLEINSQKEDPRLNFERKLWLYQTKIEEVNYEELTSDYKIETAFSEKIFKEKVKNAYQGTVLISPSREIWKNTGDGWCNLIDDNCSKFVSTDNLVKNKGVLDAK